MSAEFERLVMGLEYGAGDNFNALFRQAQQQLHRERPGGFDVMDIGRLAWSNLAIEDYPAAFRTLFYCYWLVDWQEQKEDQVREAALKAGAPWPPEQSPIGALEEALQCGADAEGRVSVDEDALAGVVHEFRVMQERLAILRDALGGAS